MAQSIEKQTGLVVGSDKRKRCFWCTGAADYQQYHDTEWGFPVTNDRRLFEKLCLEGFQSGLSWLTILRKREAFREVFCNFDFEKVSRFTQRDVTRLLKDARIVRHRGKIESVINNAKRACELSDEFGSLSTYLWRYEPAKSSRPKKLTWDVLKSMSTTQESTALSKDLKKRGWSYVGPTTVYAFMQAMGMVNDHIDGCSFRKKQLLVARKRINRSQRVP